MLALEVMRRRIASAEDLHAVVRVMKALAAVSIRQYERSVASLANYRRTIDLGLQVVLRNRPEEMFHWEEELAGGWGIIVFGSDQGMCGSFNEQITSCALDLMSSLPGRPEAATVLAVGLRTVGRLEDAGYTVDERFPVPSSLAGITPVVHDLLLKVESLRFQGATDRFFLVHHSPLAGTASQPKKVQLWPIDPQWLRDLGLREWPSRSLPTFSIDWKSLFSSLIREHLFVTLYRAFVESLASENASRLASMQAAEKNIEEHLAQLTARYSQQRQQSITEELLDIVAGFETLAGVKSNSISKT